MVTLCAWVSIHAFLECRPHIINLTGPSKLSITHPDAVKAIYSNAYPLPKDHGIHCSTRAFLCHSRATNRFTPVGGGFGIRRLVLKVNLRINQSLYSKLTLSALQAYEPVVQVYSNQLVDVIDRDLDKPIDITRWLSYYAFDVMGNLAFGKTFDMIRDGKESYFLQTIRTDMSVIGYLKHQPWLFPLFAKTPLLNANHLAFWKWIEDRMTERIEVVISLLDWKTSANGIQSWKGDRRDVFA